MSLLHGHASTSSPPVTFYSTSPSPSPSGPSDNTIRCFTVVSHFLAFFDYALGLINISKITKITLLKPLSLSPPCPCVPHKNFKDFSGCTCDWFCFGNSLSFRAVSLTIGLIVLLWIRPYICGPYHDVGIFFFLYFIYVLSIC